MKKKTYTYDYPRPALTADVVAFLLIDSITYVLLIERKNEPFKGCLALPGGHIEQHELPIYAALRELDEETNLKGSWQDLKEIGVFGRPNRDPRGWVVSIAYLLAVKPELVDRVKASDDAASVAWVSLDHIINNDCVQLAFDHKEIIQKAMESFESFYGTKMAKKYSLDNL